MKTKMKLNKDSLNQEEQMILHELEKNSKKTINTIAKNCGVSRQKVQRIQKRLEENQVIWGYTAVTDTKPQNLNRYMLLIKRSMRKIDEETAEKIAFQKFEKEYQKQGITIESSYFLHGEYDWMIIFTTHELKDAKKFSKMLIGHYQNIILKMTLMQILYAPKSHYIYNPKPETLLEFL
jgi:DNA-binding Lrp family transcriptional regulator